MAKRATRMVKAKTGAGPTPGRRSADVGAGPARAHREAAGQAGARGVPSASGLRCAVLTASDSRTRATDASGTLLAQGLVRAGHRVLARRIVADDRQSLHAALSDLLGLGVDAILITGGTGVAPRDVTPEVVGALCERTLPGFGELFRMLSLEDVGPAAYLSRALCGVRGRQVMFALPGSPAACRLALERLILPELPHLVSQLARRA